MYLEVDQVWEMEQVELASHSPEEEPGPAGFAKQYMHKKQKWMLCFYQQYLVLGNA